MTAYEDIPYDDSNVFFMNSGEIAGDNWTKKSFEEEQGMTTLASTTKEVWMLYSTAPKSFWKVENGQFVKVRPETDITLYHYYQEQLTAKEQSLAQTQEAFEKFVDGMLTNEEYETTRLQRVQLRTEMDNLKSMIASMEKE